MKRASITLSTFVSQMVSELAGKLPKTFYCVTFLAQ